LQNSHRVDSKRCFVLETYAAVFSLDALCFGAGTDRCGGGACGVRSAFLSAHFTL